ncbi:hypothetical protein JTB14_032146 [Gonioctena quinquepunctata]|nr:hypothetical protein JTB14_032146 [Gonioctena quinquepunctata]
MIKLRKCLRGEAKSAVAGMLLASENVPMVMDTLKMRFGRPDVIIEVLIAKINCIPYMKEISIEKLIIFSNEVKNLVETMKSLKSVGHMNNPQLLKDLSNKLPDILKLKWGEYFFSRQMEASIGLFSTWLADMANAACCVYTSKEPKKFEEPWKNVKKPTFQQKQKWPETVLSTNTEEIKSNGEHRTSNCPKMKLDDVNTRQSEEKAVMTVQLAKRNVLLRMIP